ncbi:FAD:protein FMN transferase, partial [bacterium]|nr:FAD:protein FMN transferase [bacterium]
KAYLLNAEKQTVRFTHSGVLLDLSGFLKGYVLGNLIEIADKEGIENLILNLGNSSVFAKGNHPFGAGWKIQQHETEIECVLLNECMTTSGNSDSTKWPIMNPLDGEILKNKNPVSVITKNPAVGEVLSKVAYLATDIERENIFEILEGRLAN